MDSGFDPPLRLYKFINIPGIISLDFFSPVVERKFKRKFCDTEEKLKKYLQYQFIHY